VGTVPIVMMSSDKRSIGRSELSSMCGLGRNLFHGTHFFHELHFQWLQLECCKRMTLVELRPGEHVYRRGDTGASLYILLKGTLGKYDGSSMSLSGHIEDGESFGASALAAKTKEGRRRAETVMAIPVRSSSIPLRPPS
jgi:CRP-like cAMP-binding protein